METPIEILKQRLVTLKGLATGRGFSAIKKNAKLAIPQFENAIAELERAEAKVETGEKQLTIPDVSALLPCPFCKSHNVEYVFRASQGVIMCNNCGIEGPAVEEAADPICDIDAAYRAWNNR